MVGHAVSLKILSFICFWILGYYCKHSIFFSLVCEHNFKITIVSEQFGCKTLIDAEWSREDADDGWELVVWMGSPQLDALDQSWRYYLYIFDLFGFILSLSLSVRFYIYMICRLPLATFFSPFVSKWDLIAITCIWTIYILLNSLGDFWGELCIVTINWEGRGGGVVLYWIIHRYVVTYCYIFLLVILCFSTTS